MRENLSAGYSDDQYLSFDPGEGDKDRGHEAPGTHLTSLVIARKPHACWIGACDKRPHKISPGERYFREQVILRGEGRRTNAICLPCIAAWFRECGR